ncbi:hypothetical protein Bsp3421_005360 [Burkholderia sp. FERM BP-3421]|uniref:hypothetical protein n=1 Tax=Burkholderia sp. FERM BP-3421 TaxID=1494466 RepID=UPI002360D80D|nr:hypothetical protein [Burkholderia sp. FERM BP-3421]WDD95196.1 hypothetical protein Bsp3421_005360 [Burkholderia sp. FERM BP-3421]
MPILGLKTVKQVDNLLKILVLVFALPFIGLFKAQPDRYDVLAYISFVCTVFAALFAGRAAFALTDSKPGQQASNEAEEKARLTQENYGRRCFLASLLFLLGAGILLVPSLYRNWHAVGIYILCICLSMLLLVIALGAVIIHALFEDDSHGFFRVMLPLGLAVFYILFAFLLGTHADWFSDPPIAQPAACKCK